MPRACFSRITSYGVRMMLTSRQQWVKQSSSGEQRKVKQSSRDMRGHSFKIVCSMVASAGMNGLLLRADMGAQVSARPDGQRPVIAGLRIYAIAIRRGGVVVFEHPGPTTHKVRTIVRETYILIAIAPGASVGVGPAQHRRMAVRTSPVFLLRHGW